jgi:Domain of unknown function (DUF4157)
MRSHDEESASALRPARPQRDAAGTADHVKAVAQRALADRDAGPVDPATVAHLQRSAGNAGVGSLLEESRSPVLDVVNSGGGRPLEPQVKEDMENSLGHDFSDVRVHSDGAAAESAKAVHAQAYTVGRDVVFDSGRYQPDSSEGRRMLAHELTHVVQQRNGPVDGTPTGDGVAVSQPSDPFEQAAEQAAEKVAEKVAGNGPSSSTASPAAPAGSAGAASVQTMLEEGAVPVQRDAAPTTEDGETEEE